MFDERRRFRCKDLGERLSVASCIENYTENTAMDSKSPCDRCTIGVRNRLGRAIGRMPTTQEVARAHRYWSSRMADEDEMVEHIWITGLVAENAEMRKDLIDLSVFMDRSSAD